MVRERNHANNLSITVDKSEYPLSVQGKCTMNDDAAKRKLGGHEGAYCSLCKTDRESASCICYVERGFRIDRTYKEAKHIYDSLKMVGTPSVPK